MNAPRAPKDPVKKREGFYILLEKELCASRQPDGRGIHYIYLDWGRILTCAEIVGHITDRKIIDRLRTTEGFRRLVHSIGVTVAAKNPNQMVKFTMQMYGFINPREGNTELEIMVPADGMEHVLLLSSVDFKDDDDEVGQMRFEFEKVGEVGIGSVKLYLNDGFHAPMVEEELPIAYDSKEYCAMIEKSLYSRGNNYRVKKVLDKMKSGADTTIAFIGGSITQGAGAAPIHTECYAYKTFCKIKEAYTNCDNVRFIKAGVGGTPSEFGMVRYEKDVLRFGEVVPDLVFVEFAVNDEDDETKGVCYESLVKRILNSPNQPAVILIFSVFANDWNLQDRLGPIGERYQLPMVSVLDAVCPQFVIPRKEGGVLTKNQYFYDLYHPGNAGHTIMADCNMNLLHAIENSPEDAPVSYENVDTVYGCDYADIRGFDRSDAAAVAKIVPGDFTGKDIDIQFTEMDDQFDATPVYPENWHYDGTGTNQPFTMTITARSLVLVFKDSDSIECGKADIYIDDKYVMSFDPKDIGWIHCDARIILNETESKTHTVQIKMAEGDEHKKFTILAFGYCR